MCRSKFDSAFSSHVYTKLWTLRFLPPFNRKLCTQSDRDSAKVSLCHFPFSLFLKSEIARLLVVIEYPWSDFGILQRNTFISLANGRPNKLWCCCFKISLFTEKEETCLDKFTSYFWGFRNRIFCVTLSARLVTLSGEGGLRQAGERQQGDRQPQSTTCSFLPWSNKVPLLPRKEISSLTCTPFE